MRIVACGLAIVALSVASAASAETLTNRSIIALTASGLDAETIIAKIDSSDANFDLSTQQLIALRKAHVPNTVIAAMLTAGKPGKLSGPRTAVAASSRSTMEATVVRQPQPPSANGAIPPRPGGIYLLSAGQLIRIDYNVSGQTKTGGFLTSALTYGIASISTKVVLQGENARVRSGEPSPVFYFYLPDGVGRASANSFQETASGPTSPNQFSLLKLVVKNGSREASIGKANITGSSTGVSNKERIDFQFDEVRPGVFSVKPTNPLAVGEYCFVMIGTGGASVAKLFDFSVQPA